MMLSVLLLKLYHNVTDRQTDGQGTPITALSTADVR